VDLDPREVILESLQRLARHVFGVTAEGFVTVNALIGVELDLHHSLLWGCGTRSAGSRSILGVAV
jgi:hypothetical protein